MVARTSVCPLCTYILYILLFSYPLAGKPCSTVPVRKAYLNCYCINNRMYICANVRIFSLDNGLDFLCFTALKKHAKNISPFPHMCRHDTLDAHVRPGPFGCAQLRTDIMQRHALVQWAPAWKSLLLLCPIAPCGKRLSICSILSCRWCNIIPKL